MNPLVRRYKFLYRYYMQEYVVPIAQIIGYTIAIGIALSWFWILMSIAAILDQSYMP